MRRSTTVERGDWELEDDEFAAALALDHTQRYLYFLDRVAATGRLWLLVRDGFAAAAGEEGELVALFPHPRYAEAAATDDWEGYEPHPILAEEWEAAWAPALAAQGCDELLVFPLPDGSGAQVRYGDFLDDLRAAG